MRYVACLLATLAASSFSARAHDLWLIPADKIEVGKKCIVHANVGMDFPKSEHAPDVGKFKRRFVIDPDGKRRELAGAGKKGNSGLLEFTPAKPGIHILAVETQPRIITLDADAFNHYLVADGLPHIYRLRFKENTLDKPGVERYSKYVKTLVHIGDGVGDPGHVLGMALEIV